MLANTATGESVDLIDEQGDWAMVYARGCRGWMPRNRLDSERAAMFDTTDLNTFPENSNSLVPPSFQRRGSKHRRAVSAPGIEDLDSSPRKKSIGSMKMVPITESPSHSPSKGTGLMSALRHLLVQLTMLFARLHVYR